VANPFKEAPEEDEPYGMSLKRAVLTPSSALYIFIDHGEEISSFSSDIYLCLRRLDLRTGKEPSYDCSV
jgi:hypothetical protein